MENKSNPHKHWYEKRIIPTLKKGGYCHIISARIHESEFYKKKEQPGGWPPRDYLPCEWEDVEE